MYRRHWTFSLIPLALAVTLLPGCRKKEQSAQAVRPDPKVAAVLAKADAFDGTPDKVVAKCGGCALKMDGSETHTIEVQGYTLRFCSDDCKQRFEKDPAKAILAMNVPEE